MGIVRFVGLDGYRLLYLYGGAIMKKWNWENFLTAVALFFAISSFSACCVVMFFGSLGLL